MVGPRKKRLRQISPSALGPCRWWISAREKLYIQMGLDECKMLWILMIYLRNHGLSCWNRRKGLLQMLTWIKSGTFRSLPHNGSLMSKAKKIIHWMYLLTVLEPLSPNSIHLSISPDLVSSTRAGKSNDLPSGNQTWPEDPASIISRWFSPLFLAPFFFGVKPPLTSGDLATFHDAEHPGIAQLHAVSQRQSSQDPPGTELLLRQSLAEVAFDARNVKSWWI